MEGKNYYKVVNLEGGLFRSALIRNGYEVIYRKDEWSRGVVGPLMVFSNIAVARSYAKKMLESSVLFECECRNPYEKIVTDLLCPSYTSLFDEFWRSKEGDYPGEVMSGNVWVPDGTNFFWEVKLLKEV